MTPKPTTAPLETPPATVTAVLDLIDAVRRSRKPPSVNVQAAKVVDQLATIDAEEAAELAASPETIRAKHLARRAHALAGVSEEVRGLVERMRGQ